MAASNPVVLIIGNDDRLRRLLRGSLRKSGFQVREADGGRAGLAIAAKAKPDLIILELALPDIGDSVILKRLRECWSARPIIVLSRLNSEEQKVAALDSGADDYLSEPFGLAEFLARVRAVIRRASRCPQSNGSSELFRSHGITVDTLDRKVLRDGMQVKLTRSEFRVLSILVKYCNLLVEADTLTNELWGPASPRTSQSCLRVYMASLRKKLEKDPSRPALLLTEPGFGYRITLDPQRRGPRRKIVKIPQRNAAIGRNTP